MAEPAKRTAKAPSKEGKAYGGADPTEPSIDFDPNDPTRDADARSEDGPGSIEDGVVEEDNE